MGQGKTSVTQGLYYNGSVFEWRIVNEGRRGESNFYYAVDPAGRPIYQGENGPAGAVEIAYESFMGKKTVDNSTVSDPYADFFFSLSAQQVSSLLPAKCNQKPPVCEQLKAD